MSIIHHVLSAFVAALVLSFYLPAAASPGHSLRQHVVSRATTDTCATIDYPSLSATSLNVPPADYQSIVGMCFCLSTLPSSIDADNKLRIIAKKYGEDAVLGDLGSLINNASNKQKCYYPDYSQPACTPDNPCGFDCIAPFVSFGGQCVCPYPYTLCNGVCGTFNQGCSSAPPQKRGINPDLKARSHGIVTNRDALKTCAKGEVVCGVDHGSSAFECLNTDVTLDSCGGCVAPNPFLSESEQSPKGIDCTALPHVRDVECSAGRCIVGRCDDGFLPSSDRRECVKEGFLVQPVQS